MILLLYVDDLFLTCAYGIFLGQGKYAVEILDKFRILDRKVITTPMASNLNLL